MPEGPEIRRAADQLARAVAGRPLLEVAFAFDHLQPYARRLTGASIEAFTPHGKALLTRFDNGLTLYSHNQLYGVWKTAPAGRLPATTRSLRVRLQTAERAALLYSASEIEIWPSDRIHEHPFLQRLGPDVLDPGLDAGTVFERLSSPRFRRRSLAALLLDQGFLAGMGNYLRSEVLFEAGLLALRRPLDLDPDERLRLAQALLDVPRRSYRQRGRRRRAAIAAEGGSRVHTGFRFAVFDRAGEPCLSCDTPVERQESAGRRLYWCPRCQC
ncbi:MAG: endonuclease VIII [Lysobacteraceae bacterium]